jgi:hypothetical protein
MEEGNFHVPPLWHNDIIMHTFEERIAHFQEKNLGTWVSYNSTPLEEGVVWSSAF